MTEYRDPDDNPLAIVPLENYTFLTSRILSWNANVFRRRPQPDFAEVF